MVTSYIDSVVPTFINGPATLTLTGRNFLSSGSNNLNMEIMINENRCNVTSISNTSILCQIGSIEAGNHSISGLIQGKSSFV